MAIPAHFRCLPFCAAVVCIGQFPPRALDGEELTRVEPVELPGGGYRFLVYNESPAPCSVGLDFSRLENLVPSLPLPVTAVIPSGVNGVSLIELTPQDPRLRNRYDYRFQIAPGDARTAKHDDSHVYWLPFEHGTKFLLSQGYRGAFSHNEVGREFALDFPMAVGTPVMAARGGTVIGTKADSDSGGKDLLFRNDGNYVRIMHRDGSVAEYVHLKKDGALVSVGDTVQAGDRIGLSGNTGRSTEPHLHFHVFVPKKDGNLKTVPTRFLDHRSRKIELRQGESYFAFHPGKPAFEAVTVRDIEDGYLRTHRVAIPKSDSVRIREDRIDNVVVLFLANGYDRPQQVRVTFPVLENMNSEGGDVVNFVVHPLTELYLTVLRPKNPEKEYRYQIRLEHRNL